MVSREAKVIERHQLRGGVQKRTVSTGMPIEALISAIDSSAVIANADSVNGSVSKQNFIKVKTITKRAVRKPPQENEGNKITSYFTPRAFSNGCHNGAESLVLKEDGDPTNHIEENGQDLLMNGHSSKPAVCTRSRSIQQHNPDIPMLNGHTDGHYLRQRTPSPLKKENVTPEGSPRSGPPTPHKIQALNEDKLRMELPLSSDSAFGNLKLATPNVPKFAKRSTKVKKSKSNPPTVPTLGTKNLLRRATKTQTGANGMTKHETKPAVQSNKIADFFPIRRSDRKSKTTLMMEKQKEIEDRVLYNKEEGLTIKDFGDKGRGVVTTRKFNKGDMVIEYIGDLISTKVAKERELKYAKDTSKGCYMYYFTHQNAQYCIDATEESGYLGRLVNHSKSSSNLITKTVEVNGRPHLILMAKKDMETGTELLYDYGDRSKEALKHHPWLAL